MTKRYPRGRTTLRGWRLSFSAFIFVVGLTLSGCSKPVSSSTTVESEIAPQPPRVGAVTVTLKLSDVAGKPVSGAHLTLEGDMAHAGMAPVFGDARQTGPGRYQGILQLTMSGDWVVLVHGILADGQKIEQQFTIQGVRAN